MLDVFLGNWIYGYRNLYRVDILKFSFGSWFRGLSGDIDIREIMRLD